MSEHTTIAWTDNTFNPWWGCTAVSPGCDNCYAEAFDKRVGGAHWGKGEPRRTFEDKHWNEPMKWQKSAAKEGKITKVFCGSMCDVMDDEEPEGQWERLIQVINDTPNLLWQLLTKRPQRYMRRLPETGFFYDNVILGTTTENQEFYDVRIPHLEEAAAWLTIRNRIQGPSFALGGLCIARSPVKTFVSYEPAIGPLTMFNRLKPSWLIFGGETGPRPRPMEQKWAENIKAECEDTGVAFFMKQMSARTPHAAADLIPAHLLVRQFPEVL